jgi:PII-like signaling protein
MYVTRIYLGHITCDKKTQFTEIEVSAFIDLALSKSGIEGATIYDATGYWKGDVEPSTVIEVVHEDPAAIVSIRDAALFLKRFLHQESVLVTTQEANVDFL